MDMSLSMFFAPKDAYKACGMFTKGHIVLLVVMLIILSILLLLSRDMKKEKLEVLIKVCSIIVVALEIIKIVFNFKHGYTWLDAWLPISYCSIFIYALLLCSYGKGIGKRMGESYIGGTAFVAGFVYLVFPSTSLMQYPMWHFLSIHSMLFHMLMMYLGFQYLKKMNIKLNRATYNYFLLLFAIFVILALIINQVTGSNLMLIREPYNIPLAIAHKIYNYSPMGYTTMAILCYLIIPFPLTWLLFQRIRKEEK